MAASPETVKKLVAAGVYDPRAVAYFFLARTTLALGLAFTAVLFAQARMGRGNRLFRVLKFRSMRSEASDADGVLSASRDDESRQLTAG